MSHEDNENAGLIAQFEKREPGVSELLEFYAGVETVYAASIRALVEVDICLVASSANNR